jgi:hypothetical protein
MAYLPVCTADAAVTFPPLIVTVTCMKPYL